jgi:hypothetical protein
MKIDLSSNLKQFEAQMRAQARAVPAVTKRALSAAAMSMLATSRNKLKELVYNKPVPRRPRSGKPRWRRGIRQGLLGAETVTQSSDGLTYTIQTRPGSDPAKPIKNWSGGYAEKRHEQKNFKYARPAPWRTEARRIGEPRAIDQFRKVLDQELKD